MNEMNVNTENGVINIRVVDVTPEYAKELLKLNTFNRRQKKGRVSMYASDMINGHWKANGVPIIIGSDNVLKDGQHRLSACIKANKTLKNVIIIKVPTEESACYDLGVARTITDTATFMGKEQYVFKNAKTMAALRTAFVFELGYTNGGVATSKPMLIKEAEKNIDSLVFINDYISGSNKMKGIGVAGVWAAILNAYNSGYPHEKLENFCKVLTNGMTANKEDFPIITLRNYLLNNSGTAGSAAQFDKFMKTQNALHNYEKGVVTERCYSCKEIYYHYNNIDSIECQ